MARIAFRFTRSRNVFPFMPGRQPSTLRFAICACGKPADIHHRLVADIVFKRQRATPVREVVFIGKQALRFAASPFRMARDKRKEFRIADRRHIKPEIGNVRFQHTFHRRQYAAKAAGCNRHAVRAPESRRRREECSQRQRCHSDECVSHQQPINARRLADAYPWSLRALRSPVPW